MSAGNTHCMFWLNYLEWTRHVDERNPAILHVFMQNCVTSVPHRPFQPIPTNISWWLSWYPSTDPIGRHHTGGAVQAALSVMYGSTNVSVCISVSVCIVNVKLLCNPPPPWMPYLTCCHWGLLCSVLGSWCYFRTHAFHMEKQNHVYADGNNDVPLTTVVLMFWLLLYLSVTPPLRCF